MAISIFFTTTSEAFANPNDKDAETVIHLLDYIARDYSVGVQDGKVINEQEYSEMLEFSEQAYDLTKRGSFLPKKEVRLLDNLKQLKEFIQEKKPAKAISELARNIRNDLIVITGIQIVPQLWPNSKQGKELYTTNCATCHGATGKGNGKLGKDLNPMPTNFHEIELMSQVSPYQAYNTIKLGVNGTSMRAFSELSDGQLWDLAFYVKSLRFQEDKIDTTVLRAQFETLFPDITLEDVATLSDEELLVNLTKKIR
jgi:high-affinity iron transporter